VKLLLEAGESLKISLKNWFPPLRVHSTPYCRFITERKKCALIFIAAGEQLHADAYQELLHVPGVQWLMALILGGDYVLQQAGARTHSPYYKSLSAEGGGEPLGARHLAAMLA